MIRVLTSTPPSCPLPISVYSTDRSKTGRFDFLMHDYTERYMDVTKKISFPDPPRPPTPGPPPRPPPIPPRPPVPTPPPSPNSSEEAEWLQKVVAKQLSILAVRLVNVWSASGMPVSLPYPPRPPTPGPRPGPVGPRPDVPTPPPSPRRTSEFLVHEASQKENSSGICGLDAAVFTRLFYERLVFETRVFVPLELTTSPNDSRKRAIMDFQKELYDDKLTNGLEDAGEMKLHTFIYGVAPNNESELHMSDLGSCSVSESSSRRLMYAGTVDFRHDPIQLQVSSSSQLVKACPNSLDTAEESLPMAMTPAISGVHSMPASQRSTTKRAYEIGQHIRSLYARSPSRNSPGWVIDNSVARPASSKALIGTSNL
ncbi:hypothetical protein F5Y06DRAFT_50717 [Hypoxylon sp. FL0890]|nr:hypothetical protein F5Y06DRAFT_50717 [Hypoxylon sp. FL0890]